MGRQSNLFFLRYCIYICTDSLNSQCLFRKISCITNVKQETSGKTIFANTLQRAIRSCMTFLRKKHKHIKRIKFCFRIYICSGSSKAMERHHSFMNSFIIQTVCLAMLFPYWTEIWCHTFIFVSIYLALCTPSVMHQAYSPSYALFYRFFVN